MTFKNLFAALLLGMLFLSCPASAYTGLVNVNGVDIQAPYTDYSDLFTEGVFHPKKTVTDYAKDEKKTAPASIDFINQKLKYTGESFAGYNVGSIIYRYSAKTKKLDCASFQIYFGGGREPKTMYQLDTNTVAATYPMRNKDAAICALCDYFGTYYGKYKKQVIPNKDYKYVSYLWTTPDSDVTISVSTYPPKSKKDGFEFNLDNIDVMIKRKDRP